MPLCVLDMASNTPDYNTRLSIIYPIFKIYTIVELQIFSKGVNAFVETHMAHKENPMHVRCHATEIRMKYVADHMRIAYTMYRVKRCFT